MNNTGPSEVIAVNADSNPYAAPIETATKTQGVGKASGFSASPKPIVDFAPIMKRWEIYRVLYNLSLAVLVIGYSLILKPELLGGFDFWVAVGFCGCACNLCFLAGPAVEGYGRVLGGWRDWFSVALFWMGLLATAGLATVFVENYPNI